ncbi:MAG TPA: hypothetical protein VL360_08065 [Gammaproteobacteria bacterium]|nr:hypothetical protein [Gammaproteobacteria bacterium]
MAFARFDQKVSELISAREKESQAKMLEAITKVELFQNEDDPAVFVISIDEKRKIKFVSKSIKEIKDIYNDVQDKAGLEALYRIASGDNSLDMIREQYGPYLSSEKVKVESDDSIALFGSSSSPHKAENKDESMLDHSPRRP